MKTKLLYYLFGVYKFFKEIGVARRKRLLIYTDSRGFDVVNKWGKSPFTSYVADFIGEYKVDYSICPEKFTTIIDFLDRVDLLGWDNYDFVIMHCGVVDFSPRPLSNINKVKASKMGKNSFSELFKDNAEYYTKSQTDIQYYGEDTSTLYSLEFLRTKIGPRIEVIKNLIWIDSNHFVPGWDGNFTKGRPSNINVTVNRYDEVLSNYVANRISLKGWSDSEIQRFTIDNIHFSKNGFNEIYKKIKNKISELS